MKIFYVVIYHWKTNDYSRWLVKGDDEDQAREKAKGLLYHSGDRVEVCYSPDFYSDFVEL